MGGNLYSKRRVTKEEYNDIWRDVRSRLYVRPEAAIPKTFFGKETFGDLDVCLHLPVLTKLDIQDLFGVDEINVNTSVVSFPYRDFQVDLCHYPQEDLDSALNYMAWGDLSNMIGVIANYAMGMRYTHRGLTCPIKLKQEEPLGEILISKNMVGILQFLDLNWWTWLKGFHDEESAFRWISESKYFNADFFKFENLNHQNRTRNRKRAMYGRFINWCEGKSFINNHEPTKNKAEHIWRAALHFNFDWIEQARPLIEEHATTQWVARTFNGDDIKGVTGLKGKELGQVINKYKSSVDDWNAHVISHCKEGMMDHFWKWWKDNQSNNWDI
jgi:hypothetical protein